MKIGIVTFHFALSYGAMLQAYALQRCLELMGHEVEMIDYQPPYHTKRFRWQWKRLGINGGNLRYLTIGRGFRNFYQKHLNIGRHYTSMEELRQNPPDVDAYICGSDQIWCPNIAERDPAYFLDFVPDDKKRIVYAASFGRPDFSDADKQRMGKLLKKMDHIGCREFSGVKLVKEIADRDAQCVLDPTLLIDDYDAITTLPAEKEQGYILEFVIQHTPFLEKTTRFIATETGLPILRVNDFLLTKIWRYRGQHRFPSPDEFLGLVKNARCIVTNSFHGTVFSLILKKQLFTVPLDGNQASKAVRMTETLQRCGRSDLFLESFDEDTIRRRLATPIDWDATHQKIKTHRETSLQYLRESLLN